MAQPSTFNGAESLTARERQVIELAAGGAANRRIAHELSLTEHTVKFHLARAFRKLGAANRTEAASIYLRAASRAP